MLKSEFVTLPLRVVLELQPELADYLPRGLDTSDAHYVARLYFDGRMEFGYVGDVSFVDGKPM